MSENKLKVDSGTIIRTVLLVVAIVNQILVASGKNPLPFSEDQIYTALSGIFTVCTVLAAWWKNNNFTQAALQAQELLDAIKEEDRAANIERKE